MTYRSVEPFSFDEKQKDDKAMLRRSLTPWQLSNPHRVRINSDTDGEIGNAVNFIGWALIVDFGGPWTLCDSVGSLQLDFISNDEWQQNCSISIKVSSNATLVYLHDHAFFHTSKNVFRMESPNLTLLKTHFMRLMVN